MLHPIEGIRVNSRYNHYRILEKMAWCPVSGVRATGDRATGDR
jgi:hypothetical protein